ncbi:cyclic pyranopterin monophosphate synthase accessory protein 2 [Methanobrevibacter cuticularis]|uniref:Cyclic pyranopterin monophosphate synthase accessory protein 2 n=1 Tax=Methanobrevibacter cuticularis TaxID=47311 RepID=A0A166F6W9_9EURY|nr:cyclic pyranopterin monophosphate synthase MoaC [Methanobrevibacter cuticularis]KZX17378.1 cyclic pyranopterin monophosphate synthase accessory protein 2 [Methanobrevibacter cuticularis]
MTKKEFTHLTEKGVHMVEVGEKQPQKRRAVANGKIILQKETVSMIENEEIKKGNVLTTAQIAAINAVKTTSNMIPLCHPLNITGIEVDFKIKSREIEVTVSVNSLGQTGVEMEAITGVSVGLLTIWDMVKAVEKDSNGQYPNTTITDICVIKKEKI